MMKRLTNNIGLKLISVVFAVILWLIVVNIDDPVSSRKFSNIPVTVVNENILSQQGKIYEVLDSSDTISIIVKAKRSILDDLSASDFVATADMQEIDMELGIVPIEVSAQRYSNKIDEISQVTNNLKVSVENLVTKQFTIEPVFNGTPAEGYATGEVTFSPNVLKVSGAESVINTISKAVVKIDVEGMNSNLDMRLAPTLLNVNGEAISSKGIEFNYSDIQCNVEMLKTKNVKLECNVVGEPAEGYQLIRLDYSPTVIQVKGDEDALASFDTIYIDSQNIDISSANKNMAFNIDISEYIPDGVELVKSENSKVIVTAVIQELKTRTFEIPITRVEIKNLNSELSASIMGVESISIIVKGANKELDALTEKDLKCTIDLKGYSEGNHNVEVIIEAPDGIDVNNKINVDVAISDKKQNSDNTSNNNNTNIE